MGLRRQVLLGLALALLLAGCTREPMLPHTLALPAQTLSLPQAPPATDGRVRFRQIFCSRHDGDACKQFLLSLNDEPPPPTNTHPPPHPAGALKLVLIPGLYDECIRGWVDFYGQALGRLREQGYDVEMLAVNSRSGSDHNAAQIAAYVNALPPGEQHRLVLLGHSKGAADILHFLVEYPEPASRIAAMVSVAGAINGSPLADWAVDSMKGWESLVPASLCEPGDDRALQSLTRQASMSWLSSNPLPKGPRYFSLVTISDSDSIAWPLRYSYQHLAEIDPRNDGLLLFFDQLIPGGELLGYLAADHWRVAYPVEEVGLLTAGRVKQAPFPRDRLLEAVMIYVAEALADARH